MPNWCSTNINIEGPMPEILLLSQKLDEAGENGKVENGFGKTWLGHLLEHLGEWNDGNPTCGCRGWISDKHLGDEQMTLYTETAWGPLLGPIVKMAEKYAPSCEIVFESIEPGCGVYLTNDPETEGKYLIDVWDKEKLPEELREFDDWGFYSKKIIRKVLLRALHKTHDKYRVEDLVKEANQILGDSMTLNLMEYCPLEEVII